MGGGGKKGLDGGVEQRRELKREASRKQNIKRWSVAGYSCHVLIRISSGSVLCAREHLTFRKEETGEWGGEEGGKQETRAWNNLLVAFNKLKAKKASKKKKEPEGLFFDLLQERVRIRAQERW